MKKFILLLAIFLMLSGVAWAQLPGINDAGQYFKTWNFNAVQTESVPSRFSVQRFTSDMDDYIDTRFFDPNIGTFMFVGGHANNSTPVVTFGFGRTIGSTYLGLYYAGSLVSGQGDKEEINNGVIIKFLLF